jgi:hypothetical protein
VTTKMADFEVEEDLDGDRYLAAAPARLERPGSTLVVHRLGWADDAAWDVLRPLIAAIRGAGTGEPHLVEVVEAGHLADMGAWVVTADPGRERLADAAGDRRQVLSALAGAASALHALHEAGVTHQGVRAEAITASGVLDLPALDRNRVVDGHVLAVGATTALDTVDPAWAQGGHPGREVDLYALGATLHRLVTGRMLHPDLATDPPVVALQRVMFEPVQLPPDLDPDLAATIAACIARDPANRPPSAQALARHLTTLAERS